MTDVVFGTWNAHAGRRPDLRQFPEGYAVRLLAAAGVDVLCVQEIEIGPQDTPEPDFGPAGSYSHWALCPSDVTSEGRCALGLFQKPGAVEDVEKCWRLQVVTNPQLTKVVDDDETWHSFDKGFVAGSIVIDGRSVAVINVHFHAFRIFDREAAEFPNLWLELANLITESVAGRPAIVAGDFNSEDRSLLLDRLPRGSFRSLLGDQPSTPSGLAIDDILVSSDLHAEGIQVVETLSDHHLCTARVSLRSP